jgi:hypothetical protein
LSQNWVIWLSHYNLATNKCCFSWIKLKQEKNCFAKTRSIKGPENQLKYPDWKTNSSITFYNYFSVCVSTTILLWSDFAYFLGRVHITTTLHLKYYYLNQCFSTDGPWKIFNGSWNFCSINTDDHLIDPIKKLGNTKTVIYKTQCIQNT